MRNEIHLREAGAGSIQDWHAREKLALKVISLVGDLRFDRGVEIVIFRRSVYDARPSELLQHHEVSINYIGEPVDIETTFEIVRCITEMEDLAPAKIDIGILAIEWSKEQLAYSSLGDFVSDRLGAFRGEDKQNPEARDVVLYGFGRIGRLLARRMIELTGSGDQLRLRAIVLRPKMPDVMSEIGKRMALLLEDSIHGTFHGTVEVDQSGNEVIINGNRVSLIFAGNPSEIDYTEYGISDALLIDNTGVWRDKAGLSQHLRPGISHVILTAPGKDVPNIVHGVNQGVLGDDDKVLSAASCTTNAIVPIIRVLDEKLGIEKGHIETIHSYTSDQNLLDNFHRKPRRGRAAAVNMVLTSTGAAKAVAKVLPNLSGKLTGNAVRVPTPNVSLAIMSLTVGRDTSVEEVNDLLRGASLHGDLVEQIHYSASTEFVSSHAVGMTTTSVFDAPSTLVSPDGRSINIYAWYDNEYGYACQVVRLAKHVARVRRYTYY